jgi:hypothetical protein
VNPDEQRRSIGKVIDLMQVKAQRAGGIQEVTGGTHRLPKRARSARRSGVVIAC